MGLAPIWPYHAVRQLLIERIFLFLFQDAMAEGHDLDKSRPLMSCYLGFKGGMSAQLFHVCRWGVVWLSYEPPFNFTPLRLAIA